MQKKKKGTWGGWRPGSGREPIGSAAGEVIAVRLDPALLRALERAPGDSRSGKIRAAILAWLAATRRKQRRRKGRQ